MHKMAMISGLILFSSLASAAPEGYSSLPNAVNRADSKDYIAFPDFPHFEFVKEGEGQANPQIYGLIQDSKIKARIDAGDFTSLQVRDLFIRANKSFSEGSEIHYPFVVSVKHTQGKNVFYNPNQGTIEVGGELIAHVQGPQIVAVEVQTFDDSQMLEEWGRHLGFNDGIDLAFAKSVVKPTLEHFFNSDPHHVQELLEMPNPVNMPRPR